MGSGVSLAMQVFLEPFVDKKFLARKYLIINSLAKWNRLGQITSGNDALNATLVKDVPRETGSAAKKNCRPGLAMVIYVQNSGHNFVGDKE